MKYPSNLFLTFPKRTVTKRMSVKESIEVLTKNFKLDNILISRKFSDSRSGVKYKIVEAVNTKSDIVLHVERLN